MLKTYELREIIENDLNNFVSSDEWAEFSMVETLIEKDNIIHANFIEIDDEGKLFENKYKITIERVE